MASKSIILNQDNIWDILDLHFEQQRVLTQHQINSFNRFVSDNIPDIIEQFNPITIKVDKLNEEDNTAITYMIKVSFTNPRINKPYHQENNGSIYPMYPNQARIRNFSYSSKLIVDAQHEVIKMSSNGEILDKKVYSTPKIHIGKIPIMLQSEYCVLDDIPREIFHTIGEDKYDYGGYFIINGSEKVVVAQTDDNYNTIYLYKNGKGNPVPYVCKVDSKIESKYENSNIVYIKYVEKDEIIYVRMTQQISNDIPLFTMFRALGIVSEKEILEYIIGDLSTPEAETMIQILQNTLETSINIQTQEGAFEELFLHSNAKKFLANLSKDKTSRFKYILDVLERHLFPHIGNSMTKKAYFLGNMVRKLLLGKMEKIPVDDRDHLQNIRAKTTGTLLSELFLDAYQKLLDHMKKAIRKEFGSKNLKDEEIADLMSRVVKTNSIDAKFKSALSTGNWGNKGDVQDPSNTGVAQVLKRLSYLDTISHLRKVVKPISSELKLVQPRLLNTTQWGRLCPAESPEGGSVGLVNNLALMCHITTGSNPLNVVELVKSVDGLIETEDLSPKQITYMTKIFVNGDWVGSHSDSKKILKYLRNARRTGQINYEISISYDISFDVINVYTEAGRLSRPVFIVENGKLLFTQKLLEQIQNREITWYNLLTSSNSTNSAVIEYLDAAEDENCLIAYEQEKITEDHTHCEIHPSMLLGVAASTIPFCNHNQGPRNVFQCAQVKQAIGIYASNFNERYDKVGHILHYPQRPLVMTKNAKYINLEEIPCGINIMLAVATYTGYNQEDSLIMNKGSIDRGLYHSTYYTTIKDDLSKGNKEYGKPDPNNTIKIRNHSFRHIGDDGFIQPDTEIEANDVIIGKIQKADKTSATGDGKQLYTDESITLRDAGVKDKKAIIDQVIVSKNGDGYLFCKVRLRKARIPVIGDKYSARAGQKGTIGMILSQEDMPFTKEGITPDIIMNPHAFPKRMTIGQILEVIFSKVAAISGKQYDGTPFNGQNIEPIGDLLEKYGFERYGNEVLYNGMTGEQIESEIFMGPCYYQKLKHMVLDKIHSRARGPVSMINRQPLEGRSKDGGLRLGEMERDGLISHSIAQFLKERFYDCSDGYTPKGNYTIIVCNTCGFYAIQNKNTNEYRCKHPDCMNKNNKYSEVYLPYATKTFIQELMAQCIVPRIIPEEPSM